jgi:hypothetical protein
MNLSQTKNAEADRMTSKEIGRNYIILYEDFLSFDVMWEEVGFRTLMEVFGEDEKSNGTENKITFEGFTFPINLEFISYHMIVLSAVFDFETIWLEFVPLLSIKSNKK